MIAVMFDVTHVWKQLETWFILFLSCLFVQPISWVHGKYLPKHDIGAGFCQRVCSLEN